MAKGRRYNTSRPKKIENEPEAMPIAREYLGTGIKSEQYNRLQTFVGGVIREMKVETRVTAQAVMLKLLPVLVAKVDKQKAEKPKVNVKHIREVPTYNVDLNKKETKAAIEAILRTEK